MHGSCKLIVWKIGVSYFFYAKASSDRLEVTDFLISCLSLWQAGGGGGQPLPQRTAPPGPACGAGLAETRRGTTPHRRRFSRSCGASSSAYVHFHEAQKGLGL